MIRSDSRKRKLIKRIDYRLARLRNWLPTAICRILAGHEWGDWIARADYNILHDRTVNHVRECWICGKREFVKASDNNMKAVEPNYRADLGC